MNFYDLNAFIGRFVNTRALLFENWLEYFPSIHQNIEKRI